MKEIVKEEVETAFLRARYWMVVTILVNLLTVGLPAVIASVVYFNQMEETRALALRNQARLESHTVFISNATRQIEDLQQFLKKTQDYKPPEDLPTYK